MSHNSFKIKQEIQKYKYIFKVTRLLYKFGYTGIALKILENIKNPAFRLTAENEIQRILLQEGQNSLLNDKGIVDLRVIYINLILTVFKVSGENVNESKFLDKYLR
jgi:hypothetical protein